MENSSVVVEASPSSKATLLEDTRDSLPIVISYLPVACVFGLSATKLGFIPVKCLFFSCIICARASQFVITALHAAGSSLWVAALTVMAVIVRQMFYYPFLVARINKILNKSKTARLWWALTSYKLRSIIIPTLLSAVVYGIT